MSELNKAELDRHITGNYGEDQFKDPHGGDECGEDYRCEWCDIPLCDSCAEKGDGCKHVLCADCADDDCPVCLAARDERETEIHNARYR